MSKFIELTRSNPKRQISILVADIRAVEVDLDGSTTVVTSAISYTVDQAHDTVMLYLERIDKYGSQTRTC